jgi:hypothetical protein
MAEQNDFVVTGESVDQLVDYCRTDFVRHLPCRQWINTVSILESLRAAWHAVHDETFAVGKLNLDAIQARCDAATPGPWVVNTKEWTDGGAPLTERTIGLPGLDATARICDNSNRAGDVRTIYAKANAAFIAHARTDVPVLLAEVRSVRAALVASMKALVKEQARVKELEHKEA